MNALATKVRAPFVREGERVMVDGVEAVVTLAPVYGVEKAGEGAGLLKFHFTYANGETERLFYSPEEWFIVLD